MNTLTEVSSTYSKDTPWGLRHRAFGGRDDRLQTKDTWHKTAKARDNYADKLEQTDGFHSIVGRHNPTSYSLKHNESVELIDAIANDDTIAASQKFNEILMSKIGVLINDRSIKVAQNMFGENAPYEIVDDLSEAKELSFHKKVKDLHADGKLASADTVGKNKDGHIVVRKGFYYSHGKTAEDHANAVSKSLHAACIEHTVVDSGQVWKPFRGGASTAAQSHYWVTVKPKESTTN